MKITVECNNKKYQFTNTAPVYIFECAIENNFDKKYGEKTLMEFINLVYECYMKDCNATPLGHLSDYMAKHWKKIKNLSRYDILEKFYAQLP